METKYQVWCMATDYARYDPVGTLVQYGDTTYDTERAAFDQLEFVRGWSNNQYGEGYEAYMYFIRKVEVETPEEKIKREFDKLGSYVSIESVEYLIEQGIIKVGD